MPLTNLLHPRQSVSRASLLLISGFWLIAGLLTWNLKANAVLPRPPEVLSALVRLWRDEGLSRELGTSFTLNVTALGYTLVISLLLSYALVLPLMRPLVLFVSKLRFLGFTGLTFVFTLLVAGAHELKLWMLVFGMTVFFVTSMSAVVAEVPKEKLDYARTLRMSEWHVVWEVVVLGTIDQAIEVLRQNAAIGWMMLTMVEGLVRSEGGVGTVLLNQNKHLRLDGVFAIQFCILAVGLAQDYLIGILKRVVCPYASLRVESR